MFVPGEVVAYLEMCQQEGASLQRGMNYRLPGGRTVVLMSIRAGAPYADRVEDDGRVLIYEGHDVPRTSATPVPKQLDQPLRTPNGTLTQNGIFMQAASAHKSGEREAEHVRVYEKIRSGIWVYNGVFALVAGWQETSNGRSVCKFRLELLPQQDVDEGDELPVPALEHARLIPTEVKLTVWKRDHGRCVQCGATDNLHFDHILPYSKGGSSLVAENIQLLCARHNLSKSARIQ